MRYNRIIPSLFKKNRQRLLNRLGLESIAVIHSNDEMHRSGDQNFMFRQNSNLFYLTGISQEKTILLLNPGHPDEKLREILFIRKSNKNLETWVGHKLTQDEASEISGIKTIKWAEDFDSVLREYLLPNKIIYYDIEEFPKYIPDSPYRSQRLLLHLTGNYPLHRFERLFPVISELRMVKEPEETELIKKACNITRDGFLRILSFIRPGLLEYEIEAELTHEFIRQGAEGHAYPPIIATGSNACTLHYIENNKVCNPDDMILMDFGAEYASYSSDLTRTIPVSGRFSKRQRELYDATLNVFKFARSLMKPGTTINKIHKEVCTKWEEEHIRLGLYTKEDVDKGRNNNPLWAKYYPHGTSHFMGLDVHDTGSKDDILKPGMILTCEPGIYLPEEKAGIRIEDDILITEDGNIDLMENIPIDPDEIEELMNK